MPVAAPALRHALYALAFLATAIVVYVLDDPAGYEFLPRLLSMLLVPPLLILSGLTFFMAWNRRDSIDGGMSVLEVVGALLTGLICAGLIAMMVLNQRSVDQREGRRTLRSAGALSLQEALSCRLLHSDALQLCGMSVVQSAMDRRFQGREAAIRVTQVRHAKDMTTVTVLVTRDGRTYTVTGTATLPPAARNAPVTLSSRSYVCAPIDADVCVGPW